MALAATVTGLARKMRASPEPMRPLELRLLELIMRPPRESTPMWLPKQGPQLNAEMLGRPYFRPANISRFSASSFSWRFRP